MKPFVEDADVTLYEGDLLYVLPRLPELSVDAVVTSPPYLDARADVSSRAGADYPSWAGDWLFEIARLLRPSGSLMLNVGRIHRDGVEVDWHRRLLDVAEAGGWMHLDTIVWHKVNGGGGRRSPYLVDRHEYVYWLARRTDVYKGFDEARVPYSPATLGRYQRRWGRGNAAVKGKDGVPQDSRTAHPDGAKPGSVFVSSVGAEKGIEHPTPMPPELAEHLVKLACPPAGVVLDPFSGSGTTALAARKLGRRCVAVELAHVHCVEAARLLAQQSILGIS